MPVFSITDAVEQLKEDPEIPRSEIEKEMDQFFLENLPDWLIIGRFMIKI